MLLQSNKETPKPNPFWPFIYLVAFLLYNRTFSAVITDFGVFPRSTDPYYNVRRIIYLVNNHFHLPLIDYYVNAPVGSPVHLPYGFAALYAFFVEIITLGQADEWWILALSSLFTSVIAASLPCIVYFLGLKLGKSQLVGFWASLIVILFPCSYYYTGYIDHNVFETFWLGLYLLFYFQAVDYLETNSNKSKIFAFLTGASVTAGILFTNALPILIAFHVGILFFQIVHLWNSPAKLELLKLNIFFFIGLLITLSPFIVTHIADPGEINPAFGFSWLVSLFLYLLLLSVLKLGQNTPQKTFENTSLLIVFSVIFFLVSIFVEWKSIFNYLSFSLSGLLLKSDPVIGSAIEDLPLWKSPSLVFNTYSYFAIFWPFALLLALKEGWKSSLNLWVLAILSLPTMLLAVLHIRFMTLFVIPYSLLIGCLIQQITTTANLFETLPKVRNTVLTIFSFFMLYPLFSSITFNYGLVNNRGDFTNLYPTLSWIKQNTPQTSSLGNKESDYSIAAPWALGNWILFFSQRPVIATPLSHMKLTRQGVRDGLRILMYPPEKSLGIIKERKTRYVLIAPQNIGSALQIAYEGLDTIVDEKLEREKISESLFVKLQNDGIPNGQAALRHFRLVHESSPKEKYPQLNKPFAMLFEYVPGVEVFGQTKPNAQIKIFARLQNKWRQLTYTDFTMTNSEGKFSFVLPYAIDSTQYSETKLISPYKIQTTEKTIDLIITESDVIKGQKREIKLLD